MRALLCVFLFVTSEARRERERPQDDDNDDAPSAIQRKVDVYPAPFAEPVPFGHITLEGFGDPYSRIKHPVDALELDMIFPENSIEGREMLKKGRNNIQFIKDIRPKGVASPRDMYLSEITQPAVDDRNGTQLKWYSMADMLRRNAMSPVLNRGRIKEQEKKNMRRISDKRPRQGSSQTANVKAPFFAKDMFHLSQDNIDIKINWTTCDEFAVKAIFSPKEIVNIDWVPFYIWSVKDYSYAFVHKFTYPTRRLVAEYRSRYGNFLNKTVDWNQPKLLLKGMNEMLLIAVDKRGLFDAITKHDIPDSAKKNPVRLPSLSIRLKIEDPYLVMTFCEDYFATVMGISGTQPTVYREMKVEAASIKFIGPGRPVWRDYEGEAEMARNIREKELAHERDKMILVNEPIPPVDQLD